MSSHKFPTLSEARRRYAHGTNARYHIGKCRCEPCREAARQYALLLRTPWQLHRSKGKWVVRNDKTGEVRHRLADKRLAERRAATLNAEHDKTRPTALVSTEPVKEHIAWLRGHGVGMLTIAPNAGVAYSVIERIFSGHITRTRRSTAEKILSVQPDVVRGGMNIRVDDTLVLIDRLTRAGYRRAWIARQLGSKTPALLIGRTPWVSIRKARAIHELYLRCASENKDLAPISSVFAAGIVETAHRNRKRAERLSTYHDNATCAHGSDARYSNGCRCKRCVKAHNEAVTARDNSKYAPYVLRRDGARWVVQDAFEHRPVYAAGARADAINVRDLFNSQDPRARDRVLVDCAALRERLTYLHARGCSDTAIAIAADVSLGVIVSIRSGRVAKTQHRHAAALLSLNDDGVPTSAAVMVDAAPAYTMIDRLDAAGFDRAWLSDVLGWSKSALGGPRRKQMRLSRARAVMLLYASLRERVTRLQWLEQDESGAAGALKPAS